LGGLKEAKHSNEGLHRDMIQGVYFHHALFLNRISPGFMQHLVASGKMFITFGESVEVGRDTRRAVLTNHVAFGIPAPPLAAALGPGPGPGEEKLNDGDDKDYDDDDDGMQEEKKNAHE
jgi:hypothetical protein